MRNNGAKRLHDLMATWNGVAEGSSAIEHWASIFRMKDASATWTVYDRVSLLMEEVQHLRVQLEAGPLSSQNYEPQLKRIERALAPSNIPHKAHAVKQYVTAEVLTTLRLCSDVLGDEEDALTEEDFAAIVSAVHDLEFALQEPTIPASLAAMIRRHVRLAEVAIAQYPLTGAKGLKEVLKTAVGDMIVEGRPEDLRSEAGDLLTRMWGSVNALADRAIRTENLIQVGTRIAQLMAKLPD